MFVSQGSRAFLGSRWAGLIQRRQEEFCRLLPCGAGGFSFAVARFCNKVSAPNFYLFVLKWPSRQSRNFAALHNQLLIALCTINCVEAHCIRHQCKAMQVNLWCGQLCWAMHDLAIKARLTNVTLFRTMHSHTSTRLTFYKAGCNLMKMCMMLEGTALEFTNLASRNQGNHTSSCNSCAGDMSISKAKRKSKIYHTCHLACKC